MVDLHPHTCAVAAYCMLVITTAAYYEESIPSLQQITGVHIPDSETHSLLIRRLAQKYYQQTGEWTNVRDPRLYFLTDQELQSSQRAKGTGLGGETSLSIVNPLDVLRQRLLLEIARRRMRESEEKIEANRQFLKKIGKRSVQWSNLEDDNQNLSVNHLASIGKKRNSKSI